MDWLQRGHAAAAFRAEAEEAVRAARKGEHPACVGLAEQLVGKYPDSPVARIILGVQSVWFEDWDEALYQLKRAAGLAPRCPYAALLHAEALRLVGSFGEAVEECDRALAVAEPADPARHFLALFEGIQDILGVWSRELRITLMREVIRWLRAMAENGKAAAAADPLEPACVTEKSVDLTRARARWIGMSAEERKAVVTLSFEEMEWYCSSGLVPEWSQDRMVRLLSGAEEFVKEGWYSYWICPICCAIEVDSTRFMSHIETTHLMECEELRWSVPERISESEKELLKSWRWEPIDGDDLEERTTVLSMIKGIIAELIDLDVVSVNLLVILQKFITKRVRPVTPTEVSMCASCGIGQLSSSHLKELYQLLNMLNYTPTDREHNNGHSVEQPSEEDSSVVITWSKEDNVLSFDCDKVASDGSSQEYALFTWLFCESLLEDPMESWLGLWQNCIVHGPFILKKINEALANMKFQRDQLEQIEGGIYFCPTTMTSQDFGIKPYFHNKIGSAHVNMLVLDAEVDYWKKKLFENCRVDYLSVISPIAKSCIWAKLNNNHPEDSLSASPPTGHALQVQPGTFDQSLTSFSRYQENVNVLKKNIEHLCFLNLIVQSLWNLSHFRNEFLRIRPPFCYKKLGGPCIAEKLYEIFSALVKNEHYTMVLLLTDMKNMLCEPGNDRNIFQNLQLGRNFASESMAMILEGLHNSGIFWSSGSTILPVDQANFQARDLFRIKLKQLMICSCGREWFGEEYTSVFHKLDANSPRATKINSFAQLPMLMDMQSDCESKCNNCSGSVKQVRHFLSNRPHFFTIVLKNGLGGDENQALLSEALYGIGSSLDITLLYNGVTFPYHGVHSATKYRLVSVICYVEQRYVCFSRDQDKWLKYDTTTVKEVDSFGELLQLYEDIHLQPEVLIYEVI